LTVAGVAPEPTQLLTAEQVAERWQMTPQAIYRMTREGQIPHVALGRYRRYRLADLMDFETNGGTADPERNR
jgi:excisionase family DNA binding protein